MCNHTSVLSTPSSSSSRIPAWLLMLLASYIGMTSSSCPKSVDGYPSIENLSSLQELNGEWVDMFSSRLADTHFECTTQSNKLFNESAFMTSTTCLLREYSYQLEVLNVLSFPECMSVFDLVPVSDSARWFEGSTFFLVDYLPDNYYSWMICNDSDEYEFHISSRNTSTDLSGIPQKVLSILDTYDLNPQNYTFYEEPHDDTKCNTVAKSSASTS